MAICAGAHAGDAEGGSFVKLLINTLSGERFHPSDRG